MPYQSRNFHRVRQSDLPKSTFITDGTRVERSGFLLVRGGLQLNKDRRSTSSSPLSRESFSPGCRAAVQNKADDLILERMVRVEREILPNLLKDSAKWSLIVIGVDPVLHRLMAKVGNDTINLHRIGRSSSGEAPLHIHPWPLAVHVLQGGYDQPIAVKKTGEDMGSIEVISVNSGDMYQITDQSRYHTTLPTSDLVFSVALNGPAWKLDKESCFNVPKGRIDNRVAEKLKLLKLFSSLMSS